MRRYSCFNETPSDGTALCSASQHSAMLLNMDTSAASSANWQHIMWSLSQGTGRSSVYIKNKQFTQRRSLGDPCGNVYECRHESFRVDTPSQGTWQHRMWSPSQGTGRSSVYIKNKQFTQRRSLGDPCGNVYECRHESFRVDTPLSACEMFS